MGLSGCGRDYRIDRISVLKNRELGLTIAGHLSNVIRADQAIQQIRADQTRAAIINRVTEGIRKSLKSADQIVATLVESIHDYFDLELCVCALFDVPSDSFGKSQETGLNQSFNPDSEVPALEGKEEGPRNLGEFLFESCKEELKQGQILFLSREEIEEALSDYDEAPISDSMKSATLVPLYYAGKFKAALCMVSAEQVRPLSEKDEHFVLDLADRVAVVISHAELFHQVEIESITDAMTGLFNRRHFEAQLSKEIDRYQRFGHPFHSLLLTSIS